MAAFAFSAFHFFKPGLHGLLIVVKGVLHCLNVLIHVFVSPFWLLNR